jgi:hypothetical protein
MLLFPDIYLYSNGMLNYDMQQFDAALFVTVFIILYVYFRTCCSEQNSRGISECSELKIQA